MRTRIKPVTAKFVEHVSQPGKYPAGDGLYLVVGKDGKSKWWTLRYRRGRLSKKGRGELGLGKYPAVSLAAARVAVGAARQLIAQGIDPVGQRKQERRDRWLAENKNLTFLQIAEDLQNTKTEGDNPWWGKHAQSKGRSILHGYLKPLHALPINSAEAAEVITLKLYEIIKPLWLTKPAMMLSVKKFAVAICQRALDRKVLPVNVANPAAGPLSALLTARQPTPGHWPAIPYQKAPALYARLEELSQPSRSRFLVGEAARAVGRSYATIFEMVQKGKLPAVRIDRKNPRPFPHEWQIDGNELFARYAKVVDVIPGIKPVSFRLIMFVMLNGSRINEALLMKWGEWNPTEQLWILPWRRTKEGSAIRQDLVIPLSEPANNIILSLKEQQQRDGIETDYVFAGYPVHEAGGAHKIGYPPSTTTIHNNLRRALPPEEIKATMHGMRTAMRSWGEDQRRPDDSPRFAEKDLERAIGHASGFGTDQMARLYTRQSKGVLGLIPIFDGWAKYLTSGEQSADIIPIRRPAIGG
jgi:integrase